MMKRWSGLAGIVIAATLAACAEQQARTDLKAELLALKEESRAQQAALEKNLTEAQKQQETLRRDLDTTDRTARQGLADQGVALEEMKVELQNLRGTLEELDHRLKQQEQGRQQDNQLLEQNLKQLNQRLDQTTALSPLPTPAGSEEVASPPPQTEEELYASARQALDAKKNDRAIELFHRLIKTYPQGAYADNAQYWLGEGYYAKRDFERAIVEFQKLLDQYPKSEKACASLLKQGFAFHELNKKTEGDAFLREVVLRCPKSSLAAKANERLGEKPQRGKSGKKK